jgi:hypothetical protein
MGGWWEATMDFPFDRPAVKQRSAAVCFGTYQARASERRIEQDTVLINPDLQNWPQWNVMLRSRYIRNKVNGEHFHKTLRQQKFLLLRCSLSALRTDIVITARGLGKTNSTHARRKESFPTTTTKPFLSDTEGSFLRKCPFQVVWLTPENEGNFESSETTHPTTQCHISEDQKLQQHLKTINVRERMNQYLPIYMV